LNCGGTDVIPRNDYANPAASGDRASLSSARSRRTLALIVSAVVVLALAATARAADEPEIESGPRVGEIADMFSVRAVTGPYRGKTLCYRCELGNGPVLSVFARRMSAPLESLFKQLDARLDSWKDGLKALVVFLTNDSQEMKQKLEALAGRLRLTRV